VVPGVTHLQFLVLDLLNREPGGMPAPRLRSLLDEFGDVRAGPKFYQLMSRLVEAGLVEAWQQEYDLDGAIVMRTCYRLAKDGEVQRSITLSFYRARLQVDDVLRGGDKKGPRR